MLCCLGGVTATVVPWLPPWLAPGKPEMGEAGTGQARRAVAENDGRGSLQEEMVRGRAMGEVR